MKRDVNSDANTGGTDDRRAVFRPVVGARYTLEELVRQITEENRHPETDTSAPVGQEAW